MNLFYWVQIFSMPGLHINARVPILQKWPYSFTRTCLMKNSFAVTSLVLFVPCWKIHYGVYCSPMKQHPCLPTGYCGWTEKMGLTHFLNWCLFWMNYLLRDIPGSCLILLLITSNILLITAGVLNGWWSIWMNIFINLFLWEKWQALPIWRNRLSAVFLKQERVWLLLTA